ncbi:nucleotidyltransferase family protein [Paraflavitalea devenefica]|uniref:nucleotidyltransferase family protein n=1 Tax=Paraflavitalea devenefica TaxID=2716334 RepID=UPI001ABBACE3|nr:nucleotidyltransferase family protein [Paraflavitalea devenefica]
MADLIKECIILAGGLGTRLRSAVPDLPKCMAPVAGRPFLSYVIDYFHQQGIERFIFSLGYMHEAIETFLHTQYPDLNVACTIEEEPLGTGGAIKLACSKALQRDVLVLNGDTIFTIQLEQLSAFHYSHAADCTLSLKPMQQFDRYGVVELATDQHISSFREKQYYDAGYINGGVYALQVPSFLQEGLPAKFSFEKDYLEKLYAQRKIYGVVQDEYFIDIGIPADYEKANREFKELKF